jgi:putative peptide zinc metalloprotease protein
MNASVQAETEKGLVNDQHEKLAQMVSSQLRADLIIRRQLFKFSEYYVVKDPLALTYFRLQPEEAYLLSLMDGKRTLGEVAERFSARFPNSDASVEKIAGFVNQLAMGGLLNISAQRFVANARRRTSVTQNMFSLWATVVSGFLFLKLPLLDPSPWLGRLAHAIRFVWTPWFVGLCLALYVWTIGFLIVHREAFNTDILNFLSPGNFLFLWVMIILIKACHEFGHATTCQHFGGEVHEMGVCLICFTPCGYVDASDAWMMSRKRHKLYTTFAGIFTELVIACIAAHLWIFLPEGFARNLAFNAMLIASVNTIVFNANPLMKFDGYYVVCDALEIPNLRAKAIAYCSYHIQRILLGYRNIHQEFVVGAEADGRMFVIYAVMAYLYMFFVIYGLTKIFARVLEPYGLHEFGLWLGIFVEGSYALLPVIKVLMDAFKPKAHIVKTTSTRRRMGLTIGVMALIFGIGFFLPTHQYVTQQAMAVAIEGEYVSPTLPGVIKSVAVRTGQWVSAGDLIATLENPAVSAELESQRVDLAQVKLRLSHAHNERNWARAERMVEATKLLEVAEAAYARAAADVARLKLYAKVAGFVVTPEVDRLTGLYAIPHQTLLRIANTRQIKLIIPLTEDQSQLVREGDAIVGRWVSNGSKFETKLTSAPSRTAENHDLMPGMLSIYGGPAPVDLELRRHQGNRGENVFSLFLAEANLPADSTDFIIEGMRARIEITGRPATPAKKIWRWMLALWNE